MPIPLSSTLINNFASFFFASKSTLPLSGVNLTALDKRLNKIEFKENGKYTNFFYNSDGNIEKIEDYDDGKMWNYEKFNWSENTVTNKFYLTENDTTIEWSREIWELNDNNQIVKIENYSKENDTWTKTGYIINTWEDGNITKQEEYQKGTSSKNNKIGNNSNLLNYRKNLNRISKNHKTNKNLKEDFTKNRTITYTYDNYKNPFSQHQALKLVKFYGWGQSNSKNNRLTKEVTNHNSGEESITSYDNYEYNEKDYPTSFQDESYTYDLNYDCN